MIGQMELFVETPAGLEPAPLVPRHFRRPLPRDLVVRVCLEHRTPCLATDLVDAGRGDPGDAVWCPAGPHRATSWTVRTWSGIDLYSVVLGPDHVYVVESLGPVRSAS